MFVNSSFLWYKSCLSFVDTCAGEFNSKTPYLYSTYDWNFSN